MNTSEKEPVYIIIPVHNRKPITLECLKNLEKCGDLQRYHTVVVDDGSTDGTSEAIRSLYPEVTILNGDGNLWWTGAIKKGMEYAHNQGAEYLIWLNDDCLPRAHTLERLVDICRNHSFVIAGGQCLDPETYEPSYGGIVTGLTRIIPVSAAQNSHKQCSGLNGNLVCLPKQVIEAIGYPNSQSFPHYHGDSTYTNAAKRRGYQLLLCGDAIAYCKNDHPKVFWINPDRSLSEFWQDYFRIKSAFYWKAELRYYLQLFGWRGILCYLYDRIFKFWAIYLLVAITSKIRLNDFKKISRFS